MSDARSDDKDDRASTSRAELIVRLQICARDNEGVLSEGARKALREAAHVLSEATDRTISVAEGESLWLIETSEMRQPDGPQRHFWTGRGWNWNPLEAARYTRKTDAEAVTEKEKMYPLDKYPVCEHLFQCGVSR